MNSEKAEGTEGSLTLPVWSPPRVASTGVNRDRTDERVPEAIDAARRAALNGRPEGPGSDPSSTDAEREPGGVAVSLAPDPPETGTSITGVQPGPGQAPPPMIMKPYTGGGIGNYLFRLCHSILYARQKATTLLVPRPLAFRTMNRLAIALDFSGGRASYGDGTESIDTFIHGNEQTRGTSFSERYQCMQELVNPLFQEDPERDRLGEDTLAIHIRSGDIFKPGGTNPAYGQPPLSWYEMLIERCGYERVAVVTETSPGNGRPNPVVDAIRKRWPWVEILSNGTEHDFHTLRHAAHLALSTGTFAVAAAMLNTRLVRLHLPIYPRLLDPNFSHVFPPGVDLGFTRCYYEIGNYECMHRWVNSPEQVERILGHSIGDIVAREESPGSGRSEPGSLASRCGDESSHCSGEVT